MFDLDVDTTDFILSTGHQKEDLIDRYMYRGRGIDWCLFNAGKSLLIAMSENRLI